MRQWQCQDQVGSAALSDGFQHQTGSVASRCVLGAGLVSVRTNPLEDDVLGIGDSKHRVVTLPFRTLLEHEAAGARPILGKEQALKLASGDRLDRGVIRALC